MNSKQNISYKLDKNLILIITCAFLSIPTVNAQVPDSEQGLRAGWLRGAWGLNWKPENFYNGTIEDVSIAPYLEELKDVRTLDYIQVHLSESNIYSPSHSAPHPLLESFWQEDTDESGNPINLIVPRASSGVDPFESWLKAIKGAGLKTMVYVNSYNLLARDPTSIPDGFPDVSTRWMEWCDTNPEAQAFINSQSYHIKGDNRRRYMFCYAEFVLKVYAQRYGDLIDAWGFDSADNVMADECGDEPKSDLLDDQRIYEAFANALHTGNSNAAVAFNNSVGTAAAPFTTPTYFDDYCFGHPFGGAGNMVETESLYTRNFGIPQLMNTTNGFPFRDDTRDWNDNVVGRFFPKLSTTSWNAGATPCLTDEQFVEWNSVGIIDAGSILWGAPLLRNNLNNSPVLTLQPLALAQLKLLDAHLKISQFTGSPVFARQETILPAVYIGQSYTHNLVEGFDFWDSEELGITNISFEGIKPSWLNVSLTAEGVWTISGNPTETVPQDYTFELKIEDADGSTTRSVKLQVIEHPADFINPLDGTPIWKLNPTVLANAVALKEYSSLLELGVHFYDFENDPLTINMISGPSWLSLTEVAEGNWRLKGIPSVTDAGVNTFNFTVSDGVHSSEAEIKITVDHAGDFTDLGDGTPVWSSTTFNLADGEVSTAYNSILQFGIDFYDFEGDALTITKTAGANWLTIQQTTTGTWELSGTPTLADEGEQSFTFNLSDGIKSSNAEIIIKVIPTVKIEGEVEIKATALTNYGIGTTATMVSDVQTAVDGKATFKVAIQVTPPADKAVISGISGGSATEYSWGLGDGTNVNTDYIFTGSDNEWVENINNIQIIDFNANGGSLTKESMTAFFKSVTIVNAQSSKDYVSLKVEGVISNPGKLADQITILNLKEATGVDEISAFSIGTGNTETTNKWAVEGISVAITYNENTLSNKDFNVTDRQEFILFPNPVTTHISFIITPQKTEIFDLTGKTLLTDISGNKTIDISSLNKGMYLIKVQNEEGKLFFSKFIKIKQ
ncbi:T9SS type A sorting domain-containing protein [Flavobacterium algicola]|uniref:T9SS type A sorting domain-containing protein n=1 Tax=Flavobacterium algicola TaxID=556529 RepID=UPI001EFEB86C|nr:T9SS type A sorting domain-containing protein [Flavobacterium algicola]MCG9792335.1 T9SS type A sorting domain-containing protein [Flavobacterium algicola]UZH25096.1 alpha-1,4-endofucoidanase [Flavobacterium algicola]